MKHYAIIAIALESSQKRAAQHGLTKVHDLALLFTRDLEAQGYTVRRMSARERAALATQDAQRERESWRYREALDEAHIAALAMDAERGKVRQ